MDLSTHGREIRIPNPIPINSKYVGDHGGHVHNIVHDPSHPHRPSTNGPPPPPPPPPLTTINATSPDDDNNNSSIITYNHESNINKKGVVVKYRECLKNHAASIGGNATDGCGEFMPSGEEGTMEALKCSACNCHRNFHRKEVEGESSSFEFYNHNHLHLKGRKLVGQKGVLISGSDPFGYNPSHNSLIPMPSPHHMIMPLGAIQTSESDEMEGGAGVVMSRGPVTKKRFRTKFTPEQKEKMMSFAEKIGWRLQKQEESVVQQFCTEIGVKRRVLKVWMHNNKHQLSRKGCIQLEHF